MARDFIFRLKPGEALPPSDPTGPRVLLDTTGQFKLLNSDRSVSNFATASEYTETTISLTPTQIKTSGVITLIPSPSGDEYLDIDKIIIVLKYANTPYDAGRDGVSLKIGTAIFATLNPSFINSSQNLYLLKNSVADSNALLPGTALTWDSTSNTPTVGDSIVDLIIYHKTRKLYR